MIPLVMITMVLSFQQQIETTAETMARTVLRNLWERGGTLQLARLGVENQILTVFIITADACLGIRTIVVSYGIPGKTSLKSPL